MATIKHGKLFAGGKELLIGSLDIEDQMEILEEEMPGGGKALVHSAKFTTWSAKVDMESYTDLHKGSSDIRIEIGGMAYNGLVTNIQISDGVKSYPKVHAEGQIIEGPIKMVEDAELHSSAPEPSKGMHEFPAEPVAPPVNPDTKQGLCAMIVMFYARKQGKAKVFTIKALKDTFPALEMKELKHLWLWAGLAGSSTYMHDMGLYFHLPPGKNVSLEEGLKNLSEFLGEDLAPVEELEAEQTVPVADDWDVLFGG